MSVEGEKKVLLLTGLFPSEIRNDIIKNSKVNIQFAADALQWSLVKGLSSFYKNLKIFNFPFIGAFPTRYNYPFVKSFLFQTGVGVDAVNIGYINLVGLKNVFIYRRAKKKIAEWLSTTDGKRVVLIYAAYLPFLKAAVEVTRKSKDVQIGLILPDLPQFMNISTNIVYKAWAKHNKERLKQYYKEIDYFILLSKYMAPELGIESKKWIVMEGIYNDADLSISPATHSLFKTVFYSGTLARRYGILNLVNAFKMLDDADLRLVICGDGDAKDEIIKAAKMDKRIIYKGPLDRKRVLMLQKEATLLINPRTSEGEFTKFSFPSKTMEYFGSGVPVLMYRLQGIPDEYYEHCYSLEDPSVQQLADEMFRILKIEPSLLLQKGKDAKKFVLEKKNPKEQCRKIFNLIEETNV